MRRLIWTWRWCRSGAACVAVRCNAATDPVSVSGYCMPLVTGVGYGMVLVTFFIVCYYNLILAWTIFYTAASFRATLGWSNCEHE